MLAFQKQKKASNNFQKSLKAAAQIKRPLILDMWWCAIAILNHSFGILTIFLGTTKSSKLRVCLGN
jgi:hypothetical protein